MPTLTVFPQSNRQGDFDVSTPGALGDGVTLTGALELWLDIDPGDALLPEHEAHVEVFASPDGVTWRLIARKSWFGLITTDRNGVVITQPRWTIASFDAQGNSQYTGQWLRATLNVPDRMRVGFFVDYQLA